MKITPNVILLLLSLVPALGQADTTPVPASVSRYEQVLLRRPEAGPAFDRVLEFYQSGPGTEMLEARWSSSFQSASTPSQQAGWATLSGILSQRQGDNEAAIDWFEKALATDPSQIKTRIALGSLLANSGQFPEAIAILQAGLDPEAVADPDQNELYRQLALTQERNFQTEEAIQTWLVLANQEEADSFTLEEAAEALARNQAYASAEKIFAKLAERSENDPYQKVRFQIRLARLKEANGQYDEALEIYHGAMPRTSGTSWLQKELRTRIEQLYRKQEDLPGLADYYETQLETRGRDSETALLLAQVLDELGRNTEATEWIQQACEWSPSRTDLSLLLADRYLEEEAPDSAIEILMPLATSDPSNLLFAERLGDAYWERYEATGNEEDRDLALSRWNTIAPPDTTEAPRVMRVAGILRRYDLADETLSAYARAASLDPDSIDIREQWADWLYILEQPEEGNEVLSGIVAGEDQQTAPRYLRLAQLRKRYGDRPAALTAIEQGLRIDPDSFDLLSLQWSVLAEEERWADAAFLYPALVRNAPNDFFRRSVDQRHIQALAASKQLESSREELTLALESHSISEDDTALLLQIAIATRNYETADLTIEEIRQRFPDSLLLAEISVSYFADKGDPDQAIATLETLLSLEPKRTDEWLQQIATIQLNALRYRDAAITAKERVALNPSKMEAQLFLADIYQNEGRMEKAVETLEAALKLAEDPTPIRQRLIDYLSAYGKSEEAY
ncbi:MAG: tetratricopeptide repeat protein, partial [Puniceicoccales bacterium]